VKTYSRHDFTREERAASAKVAISAAFESKEQAFLDFVLSHSADAVQLVEQHHNSVVNDIKAWRAKSRNTAFNAGECSSPVLARQGFTIAGCWPPPSARLCSKLDRPENGAPAILKVRLRLAPAATAPLGESCGLPG
jgi:hypothetical protein